MALTVQIVGPERTLWSGEASALSVPAAEGDMGILPGRQPVLAVLRPGKVHITQVGGGSETVEIQGGFVSLDEDAVTIVVDEQDERRAEHAEAAVDY
ncbi:F0F1 ATP synthase subunit epsilon [uncultured Georgenia sp.]|uniref:F0F1 ATP synthase subunit epsilon n=1 Tax=uncultured Georgenia sp. TaxID=378209 RepID=UPI0026233211|nr:F0F1 ATP synthase subunit epsilon [uncultured Georgenia sp.]HLV05762.1 F0F1 ATP synthase subunit epsilon [Actinomycetaceae bacterium]